MIPCYAGIDTAILMLAANYPIQHYPYSDATSATGYRKAGNYPDVPVTVMIYGPAPQSSNLTEAEQYTTRVTTRLTLLVPDVTIFSVRDKVDLPEGTFLVSESVRDFTRGPFGHRPGGEVIVEKVDG